MTPAPALTSTSNRIHVPHNPTLRATMAQSMAAFDALPVRLRRAIAEANTRPSPVHLLRLWRKGWDEVKLLTMLTEADAKALRDISMLPIWGAHHPQEIPTNAPAKLRSTAEDLGL